jgi:SDR family mycofactocin-dependent oxidoreductase
MSRFDGKVAFITGAARGQGRAEAVRLAKEGADIIAIDIAAAVETNIAAPATPEDLAETVRMVEQLDRRIYSAQADVRDYDKLKFVLDEGVAELGRLDIVIANAGMWSYGLAHELTEEAWQTVIDVDLTGVWHTMKAVIPILKQQGTGGSIILTSSALGLMASPNVAHYVAAKHGVVGLMRTLALELASDNIRVNTVNPTSVNTDLIQNAPTYELFAPDLAPADRTREAIVPRFAALTPMNIPWVEADDVANAVAWLASDDARYVTGITLPVDAGQLLK